MGELEEELRFEEEREASNLFSPAINSGDLASMPSRSETSISAAADFENSLAIPMTDGLTPAGQRRALSRANSRSGKTRVVAFCLIHLS